MISFYPNGWLNSNGPQLIDWETFLDTFIFNQHRSTILEDYKLWLAALNALELGPFHQWINGSFISKKPSPNDLDVVTFIPAQAYDDKEIQFRNISKGLKNIDCYWVKDYPTGIPNILSPNLIK